MSKNYFTLEQANNSLVYLRPVVEDILINGRLLMCLSTDLGGPFIDDPELKRIKNDLRDCLLEVEEMGAIYNDWNFSKGVIDFPAKINGKELYLNWQEGEPSVKFFYNLNETVKDRRDISELNDIELTV